MGFVQRSTKRVLRATLLGLLLLLREFRDRSYMVLMVSVGAGLVAHALRPPIAWGVGMVVFGGLSLYLRHHGTDTSNERDPDRG